VLLAGAGRDGGEGVVGAEPVPVAPTFEELVAQASTFEELKALVAAKIA
jgi:hypothetical protein